MLPSNDLREFFYMFFNLFGGFALLTFNLTQLKRKKFLLSKFSKTIRNFLENKSQPVPASNFLTSASFWAVIETIFISCFQYLPISFINKTFGAILDTGANYYGLLFFAPVIILLFCCLLWVNPLKQMDLITPAFPLALVFSKIGCFTIGCCSGIPWSYGLYNYYHKQYEFPIQLLEAGLALIIFIFLLFWRDKAKAGTLFPIYLILYSGTRFFSEFLSGKPAIIWIFKKYHILCFIGVIIGILELLFVRIITGKINSIFAEKSSKLE